jgi:hypothetical protein
VIRCKSLLYRVAVPTDRDACRLLSIFSVVYMSRGSPRTNQLHHNTAVVTFMVHPSQHQDRTPCFPVADNAAANKARFRPSLPVDLLLVDDAWRLLLYVCTCCRHGYVHCMRTRRTLVCRFVTKSKYTTVNAFVYAGEAGQLLASISQSLS